MLRQIRSLMLPPGLRDSSLTTTVAFASFVSLFNRTSGVLPIVSKMLFAIFACFYLPVVEVLLYNGVIKGLLQNPTK